jgi:hypothetical protein
MPLWEPASRLRGDCTIKTQWFVSLLFLLLLFLLSMFLVPMQRQLKWRVSGKTIRGGQSPRARGP